MVGREVETGRRQPSRRARSASVVLEAHDLHAEGDRGLPALRGVSLAVRGGEIVGIAGVAGNGQRELAEALTGLRAADGGPRDVSVVELRPGDPRDAIAHGVAHVPEDRLGTGVAPSLSIASNTVLKAYRDADVSAGPFLRRSRIVQRAVDLIARYGVQAPGPEHARPRSLGRQPAEGRDRARVRGRAARARRRGADARPRRRRDRGRARAAARRGRAAASPC